MTKIFYIFIIFITASFSALAKKDSLYRRDKILRGNSIDFSITNGAVQQQAVTMIQPKSSYLNLTENSSQNYNVHFKWSSFRNVDITVFNYWGQQHKWGCGVGLMAEWQKGSVTVDNLNIQFQSYDYYGNPFRQIVKSTGISEKLHTTKFDVPLVLRFKHESLKYIGYNIDLGLLLGVYNRNRYDAEATFDYEAVYKRLNGNWVYDGSPNLPQAEGTQVLLTKNYIIAHNPALSTKAAIDNYFQQLKSGENKYNVGLDHNINVSKTTHISHMYSIGAMLRGNALYNINSRYSINIGGFGLIKFDNSANRQYQITNSVGEYSSLLNGVAKSTTFTYGITTGIKYYFLRNDIDGDGVPNKRDECPNIKGETRFAGCPDKDGDGIPDWMDRCPGVTGISTTCGCPDNDRDDIANKEDSCMDQSGTDRNKLGCPLSSNLPQVNTTQPGTVTFKYYFYIPFPPGVHDLDSYQAKEMASMTNLLEGASQNIKIIISAYSDSICRPNDLLSISRATAIKDVLLKHGYSDDNIIINNVYSLGGLSTGVAFGMILFGERSAQNGSVPTKAKPRQGSDEDGIRPIYSADPRLEAGDPGRDSDTKPVYVSPQNQGDENDRQQYSDDERPIYNDNTQIQIHQNNDGQPDDNIQIHLGVDSPRLNGDVRPIYHTFADPTPEEVEQDQREEERHRGETGGDDTYHIPDNETRPIFQEGSSMSNISGSLQSAIISKTENTIDYSLPHSDFDEHREVYFDIKYNETTTRNVKVEWQFSSSKQFTYDVRKELYIVLLRKGVDCPPKIKKITDGWWKCGNGLLIQSDDKQVNAFFNKYFNK